MIQLYVADDHPVVVEGLERYVALHDDLTWLGSASSIDALNEALDAITPDVLVLDVQMPGNTGVDTVRSLVERGLRVVLFTLNPPDRQIAALVAAGAQGFVSKSLPLAELIAGVRAVAAGERHVPEALDALASEVESAPLPHEQMTKREHQVFVRLARCETPKEIAFDLELSQSTVYTYVDRVRDKLGVSTLAEVVRYAAEHGLT